MIPRISTDTLEAAVNAERARILELCSVPNDVTVAIVNRDRIDAGKGWKQLADEYNVSRSPFETLALRIRIARGDHRRAVKEKIEPVAPHNADLLDQLRRETTS
jgi:hypothetical protein